MSDQQPDTPENRKTPEPYVRPRFMMVPTDDARNLVAYLKSLDHSYDVPPAENYGRLK